MTDAELIVALKDEAQWLLGASLRHGSADAGMSGSLADAAADRIEALADEIARLNGLLKQQGDKIMAEVLADTAFGELTAEVARLREALVNLIDRYDEVVTTPDCSCSQDDHDVMMARRAVELSLPE